MASREPTMADVAKAAGVSTALVSIIFREVPGASESTRKHVRKVARELGYIPDRRAQKLRQSRSGLIGITFELQQPFHGDLVEQLYPALAQHGYDLALSGIAPTRDERTAIDAVFRERCEAAILLGSRMTSTELSQIAQRLPIQVVAQSSGTKKVGAVRIDDTLGIAMALDHLISLGHRDITYIHGGDSPGAQERTEAFTIHTEKTQVSGHVVPGGATETDGANAMVSILNANTQPTAVIAFNDRVAIGVLDVLLRHGIRVPEDISVIGYDDSRLSRLAHIRLTTVAQDTVHIATEVAKQAIAQIAGGNATEIVLAPQLIPRHTTGPVSA